MGKVAGDSSEYLVVDLDGSLIKTDLLFESFVLFIQKQPLGIFKALKELLTNGRAGLKSYLAEEVEIHPEELPYNTHLLDYIVFEKNSGRKVILATASTKKYADQIAEHLGVFDKVIASDKENNLKGTKKLEIIKKETEGKDFEYVGNSSADIPIWKESKEITVVSDSKRFIKRVIKIQKPKYLFSEDLNFFKVIAKTIRVHQWLKNLLLFVPLIMAQQVLNYELWWKLVLAFFSFSLTASAVYVINDIYDLSADRFHPTKKKRPIAAGDLSIAKVLLLIPVLLFAGLSLSLCVSPDFACALFLYLIITTAYTFKLKRIVIFDIVTLASLYSLRIFAGGAATGLLVSPWLIAFSVFFFLSLASLKRFIELSKLTANSSGLIAGRGYCAKDLSIVSQAGISSGFISVLVLALYINGAEVVQFYSNEYLLWLLCPIILYWIFRIWVLANRQEVHHDPVLFAAKDKVSYIVILCIFLILFFATV